MFDDNKQLKVLGVLNCVLLHTTPFAASFKSQMLSWSSMQDKVGSRTLEGRRLRRHVLKGAVIVFITAGYSGKKFIFEKVTGDAHHTP